MLRLRLRVRSGRPRALPLRRRADRLPQREARIKDSVVVVVVVVCASRVHASEHAPKKFHEERGVSETFPSETNVSGRLRRFVSAYAQGETLSPSATARSLRLPDALRGVLTLLGSADLVSLVCVALDAGNAMREGLRIHHRSQRNARRGKE